jgi:hypothetical protein
MKLGYVIYRISVFSCVEMYVINPSNVTFLETENLDNAAIFDTAREAYERATYCGLLDWKVGLR